MSDGPGSTRFDVLLRGGEVVDGTGGPRRRADVGLLGDRIVAIGDLADAHAASVLDVSGRVVVPGFIDVHTHVDAQVFWDSTVSPSPLHGVTTVIGGNCGFSVQPLSHDPADGEYLIKMLSRVEGMPLASLLQGAPWDWVSTADYLDALEHRLSVNAGFKVGHCALRRVVMGADATNRAARPDEVASMCDLLRRGIEAGALGFSSTWSTTHNDTEQNMVPSRYADRTELLALCGVLADHPGTSLEFIPTVGPFDDSTAELLADMAVAAKAPLNWNVLPVNERSLDFAYSKLAASDVAEARGAKVVGLTAPMTLDFRLCFRHGFLLDVIPGWEDVMLLPHEQKKAAFADPVERARLGRIADGEHLMRRFTHWGQMEIFHTVAPENEQYRGRRIGEIATELGKSAWDTICDISLADDLGTSFGHPAVEEPLATWEARVQIWRDPRAVIGASDAGAHLDMFFSADYATKVLEEAVVKRQLMPLEEAVHLLTAVPADLYRIKDRGRVVEGAYADLVVLDERHVGTNPMQMRNDLPGGAPRLYAEAKGIDRVFCNGREIVRNGEFTDERPGTILRAGVHTG